MTRLTLNLKSHITYQALIKAGVIAREVALAEKMEVWSEKVRIKSLGGQAERLEELRRQFAVLIAEIPEHLRNSSYFIRLRRQIRLNLAGKTLYAKWEGDRVAPYDFTILHDDPLRAEHDLLTGEADEIADARAEVNTKVRAMLNSCTTVKKLLHIWPEVSELLPSTTAAIEVPAQLPAVLPAELNKLIGLPSAVPEVQP